MVYSVMQVTGVQTMAAIFMEEEGRSRITHEQLVSAHSQSRNQEQAFRDILSN